MDEAEQLAREELSQQRLQGTEDDQAIDAQVLLGHVLLAGGRFDEAEPLLRDAYAKALALDQERKHWKTHYAANVLGAALVGQGKLEEAEPLILATCEFA